MPSIQFAPPSRLFQILRESEALVEPATDATAANLEPSDDTATNLQSWTFPTVASSKSGHYLSWSKCYRRRPLLPSSNHQMATERQFLVEPTEVSWTQLSQCQIKRIKASASIVEHRWNRKLVVKLWSWARLRNGAQAPDNVFLVSPPILIMVLSLAKWCWNVNLEVLDAPWNFWLVSRIATIPHQNLWAYSGSIVGLQPTS